jgi:hypothetical protein
VTLADLEAAWSWLGEETACTCAPFPLHDRHVPEGVRRFVVEGAHSAGLLRRSTRWARTPRWGRTLRARPRWPALDLSAWSISMRREAIRRLADAGVPRVEIARVASLSRRRVDQVLWKG